jgi:hypothetical protein
MENIHDLLRDRFHYIKLVNSEKSGI